MSQFNEHSEVSRPTWLGEQWHDSSWHNDAMPHCTLFLTPDESGNGPCIEFWVNYPDPAEREIGTHYEAVYQKSFELESGRDRQLWAGENEATAQQYARAAEIARSIILDILSDPIVTTSRGTKANLLDAGTFSELHDYCDANMLGDSAKLLDEFGYTAPDAVMDDETRDRLDENARNQAVDILNIAQEIVEVWLQSRIPEKPLPPAKFKALIKKLESGETKLSDIEVPPPQKKRKE